MESDHPVKPAPPVPETDAPPRYGAASAPPRESIATRLEVPLYRPVEDDGVEMDGSEEPRVSAVLGPLPTGVSLAHTHGLNDAVHRILVVGLVISTALLLSGIILDLVMRPGLPIVALLPREAVAAAFSLQPSGFLSLGLLVLLATPIVRVIGSVVVFVWERDWRFALITSLVLVVMIVSIIVGRA